MRGAASTTRSLGSETALSVREIAQRVGLLGTIAVERESYLRLVREEGDGWMKSCWNGKFVSEAVSHENMRLRSLSRVLCRKCA